MPTSPTVLENLAQFQNRDLFSIAAWGARGLNPSNSELSGHITTFFHDCAKELEKTIKAGQPAKELKATLIHALSQLNKADYNTEEREFIAETFFELSGIVDVDLRTQLNAWLYDSFLATLIRVKNFLRPQRVLKVLQQPCTNCQTPLKTKILRERKGIPPSDWLVIKCNNCGEPNLFSHGPDIESQEFENYTWIESLSKEDFTREQALVRMEQIKYFRKQ